MFLGWGTSVVNFDPLDGLTKYEEARIGRYTSAFYYQGDIGEIIMYDRALSPYEIDKIEEYLSEKWKINLD